MAIDYGLKVSKAGQNVVTASEANLQFTSQYPVLKAAFFGEVSTTGGSWYDISHNLGYTPAFICWAKGASNTKRFLMPRFYSGADPVGGMSNAWVYTTTTTLSIFTSASSSVYYYIFADQFG